MLEKFWLFVHFIWSIMSRDMAICVSNFRHFSCVRTRPRANIFLMREVVTNLSYITTRPLESAFRMSARMRARIFCARRRILLYLAFFDGFCRFSQKLVCGPHVLVACLLYFYELATKRYQELVITHVLNGVMAIWNSIFLNIHVFEPGLEQIFFECGKLLRTYHISL